MFHLKPDKSYLYGPIIMDITITEVGVIVVVGGEGSLV